jgi:pyridoxal phosphate-dependent aminotransferase EpsN
VARIFLSPPDVSDADRRALLRAFDSGWVAPAGPDLAAFEEECAAVCGRRFGVALSSGTAALHLALVTMGVGAGDDVIVSTFTFAASVNAVVYVGARPVLIDSDEATWNLSADLLEDELAARRAAGAALPKAAIVVDLYGQCADYGRIVPLLESYGVPLIGDAAEALGATFGESPAGSFGVCSAVSFNGNKIITTSGGGMFLTDDEAMASRVRHLATQAREPEAHYEHVDVGYNYRLSNLLAAMGRSQLADLGRRVARRREIFDRYVSALGALPGVSFMPEAPYGRANRWLTCLTIDPAAAGFSPEELRLWLEEDDIESRPTWKPMHLQPAFSWCPARVDGTSERLFTTGLCLPSGSSMTSDDQERVISRAVALGGRS